jgi:imidazolonepropionase-like amidohydrolase
MGVIFQNCRLIDGISDAPRNGCAVVVEGDRITAIESASTRPVGEHTVIPGDGRTLLPGLIDCHAHYVFDPRSPSPFVQARDASREHRASTP